MKSFQRGTTFVRFLNLVRAIRELPDGPLLDPTEERLINYLAVQWLEARPVTVLEAMRAFPDASTTTVHRRLKALRSKGFIHLESDLVDNRVKLIVPTEMAINYFQDLSNCMEQAILSEPKRA